MEALDGELIDEFLPDNVFEDEFGLDLNDELMIRGIKEELESWTGSSSASSSPTFIHPNASPGLANDSFSDEEKAAAVANPYDFLGHVVVSEEEEKKKERRDTPSPGSTSSSSGFFSDVSCTTHELPINVFSVGSPIVIQQPRPSSTFAQIPPIVPVHRPPATTSHPRPIVQIKPKPPGVETTNPQSKTIVLSPQDFSQLMRNIRAPRIQSQPPTVTKPATVAKGVQQPSSMFCLPSQVVDERTYKKQQRLIRNRESANLSRRKKKEFIDSLQETIQQIGSEKEQLINENNQLRTQLLSNVCNRCNEKIAGRGADIYGKSSSSRPLRGFVTKKNSVLVLAMFLLTVSVNFGPLNNMLSSPASSKDVDRSYPASSATVRRHILWAADEQRNNSSATDIRSRRDLRGVVHQFPDLNAAGGNATYPKCAQEVAEEHYINQTENIRIASELRRWIGEPEYLNLTRSGAVRSLVPPWQDVMKREPGKALEYDGNFLVNLMPKKYSRNKKLQHKKIMKKGKKGKRTGEDMSELMPSVMEVDIFKSPRKVEMKYAELFEELRRRDDTFYVVSFTADHLMLPALNYNKTFRPKMSLMFPAVGFNESLNDSFITMMQIDCEVLDTTLIQVKERLIPDHLRRLRNDTKSARRDEEVDGIKPLPEFGPPRQMKRDNVTTTTTDGERFAGKPYFLENRRFDNRTAEGIMRTGFE